MKPRLFTLFSSVASLCLSVTLVQGATYYWDGTDTTLDANGGNGTWDTSATNWDLAATGGANIAWTSTNVASFGGSSGTVTVSSGLTAQRLEFTTNGYVLTGGSLTLNGGGNTGSNPAFQVNSGVTATVNTQLSTTTGETWVRGGGTLVLGNTSNIINGSLVITGGSTLEVANLAAIGTNNSSGFALNGGTFRYTGSSNGTLRTRDNWGFGIGANTLDVTQAGTVLTIGTQLYNNGGTVSLTKAGAGTLLLTNANTYTGGVAVQNGVLQIGGGSGSLASQALTIGNSTNSGKFVLGEAANAKNITITNLNSSGSGASNAIVGGSTNVSTLTIDTTTFGNYVGTLGGAGTNENNLKLVKTGTGVVTLSGANTLTGKVEINGGLLGIRYGTEFGSPGSFVSDQLTINGATLMNMTDATGLNSFSSGWSPTIGANVGVVLGVNGATMRVGYGASKLLTINGTISGVGSLSSIDTGTLVLGGDNTFTGDTNWTYSTNGYGKIRLANVNALKNSTVDMTNGTGLLDLNGLDGVVLGGLKGGGDLTIGNASRVLKVGNNSANTEYSGVMSTGVVRKIGTGTWTMSGAGDNANLKAVLESGVMVLGKTSGASVHAVNATGGAIGLTIQGGTAKLGGSGGDQIASGAVVHMTGGTFDLAGNSEGFQGLSGTSGIVTNSGGSTSTLTLGENTVSGDSLEYAGNIQGNVGLSKVGGGKTILSGTNTYSGVTQVSSGALAVNGSLGNTSVTVSGGSAAKLQGSGTIAGTVTIGSNGILAAGNSIESLATGSLSLTNGATFEQEISGVGVAGADLVAVTGDVSLTGTVTLSLLGSGTWNVGDKLTLISYTGALLANSLFSYAGGDLSGDGLLQDDEVFTYDNQQWVMNYNDTVKGSNYGTDATGQYITMTVIPEPSAALLGGLGVLMLIRRRRQ